MAYRGVILLALALLVPLSGADQIDLEDQRCATPPCGWILPTLDIVVDDKLPCGGGHLIYATGPPEDCFEILAPGEVRAYPARLILKWEITEEGTYPKDAGTDIVISFSGTANNAPWLRLDVSGEDMVDGTYVIDDAALFHPDNTKRQTNAQGQESVWFWFERDITITMTRSGDPDRDELKDIDNREGVLSYFVKTRSTESGPRFKEGFGIEEFRFNTCTDAAIAAKLPPCGPVLAGSAQDEEIPGLAWPALVGVLAGLVMLRRR